MTQKEKIKHERVLKLKKIGFWTLNIVSYILAGIFLIVLIISLSTPKKQNVSPRVVNNLYNEQITEVIIDDTPNNVVYDDEEYQITLTPNETNNYVWNNFYTLANNDYNFDEIFTNIEYDSVVYSYGGGETSGPYWENGDSYINFITNYIDYNNANQGANLTENYIFVLQNIDSENDPFVENVILNFDSAVYNPFKTAIQLDISANAPSETQTIFESITQVLTNFITTLNSGVSAVINLFWNSTTSQLTLLGNLTTIVIGVAVCFFLFRLVIGLIRLRG